MTIRKIKFSIVGAAVLAASPVHADRSMIEYVCNSSNYTTPAALRFSQEREQFFGRFHHASGLGEWQDICAPEPGTVIYPRECAFDATGVVTVLFAVREGSRGRSRPALSFNSNTAMIMSRDGRGVVQRTQCRRVGG